MKNSTILLLTFIISNCKISNKNDILQYENLLKNQMELNIKNDTTFLGFTFNMDEKQTERKINELIWNGKIGKTTLCKIPILNGTSTLSFDGNPYTLNVSESEKFDGFILTDVIDKKLSVITLVFPDSNPESILNFLNSKYGDYIYLNNDDTKSYFWIKNNQVIKLNSGYRNDISFMKLKYAFDHIWELKYSDSIKKINKKEDFR